MINTSHIQSSGGGHEDTVMPMSSRAIGSTNGASLEVPGTHTGLLLSIRPEDFNALVHRAAQQAAELLGDRPDYMTTDQVAEYLGWPVSRIDNLCSQRRIPYSKDGGRRIFVRQEIDAWVKGLEGVTVQEAWALVP